MNIFNTLNNLNSITLLAADPNSSLLGSPFSLTIIMLIFIVFFYFFVVRPQNKKRKEVDLMLKNMKKGDKVVSIGGIHGKVSSIKDNEIVVKVDANTELTFEKSAIARVVASTQAVADNKEKKNK